MAFIFCDNIGFSFIYIATGPVNPIANTSDSSWGLNPWINITRLKEKEGVDPTGGFRKDDWREVIIEFNHPGFELRFITD